MPDTLRDRVVTALSDSYDIDSELGRGGMGVVYKALDRKLRRAIAIKVLPPELAYREDVKQRFLREAQTAAALSHPNIVPIYAVEERDGLVCFVMALVEGESLATRLVRENRPPIADVCSILRGVADALSYAHAHGTVHRDIKPDNILLDRHTGRPMVTDFGIARAAEGDARLTVTGVAIGTPAYMSPEQAMGEREIDGRSDLYSLAIVGYQMLAGELPFQATNTPSMLMKHISDTPRPLRETRRDLPAALMFTIERAMAKKPNERWPGAEAFREALGKVDLRTPPPPAREVPPYMDPGLDLDADERVPRLSSAWKHSVPPPDAQPPRLRDLVRSAGEFGLGQVRVVRDAVDAANAGWGPPGAARDPGLGLAPLAPVPDWMPPSWRDARRQWRGQQRAQRRQGAHLRGEESLGAFGRLPLSERIRAFRRRTASGAVTIAMMAGINLAFSPHFWWFLFPAGFMTLGWMQRAASLWADGVRARDVFGRDARATLQANDQAASALLSSPEDYVAKLAPADVLAGPYGDRVRRAASDRTAVREVVAKLSKADSQLIPDVVPTVDALVERVGSLAHALHRLEEDVSPTAIDDLDRRIAAAKTQPESRERDQKVQLLERQRATLTDLLSRRETLLAQLESASLTLQNMRLDMIALRSAGVQSVLDDVTSATQEARALSRDIAHVLEAAKEIR